MIDQKKTIVITESQMLSLMLEAIAIPDIYKKYYSDIPEETFYKIIQSDPTYNFNKSDKMGKYGKWLLNLYKHGSLKDEDLYKAKEDLEIFAKFQNKLQQKDIMKYRSLSELYDAIKPFVENPQQVATKSEEVRQIKKGAEKVYEDNKWLVIVPHTQESSSYYGKGTRWCTAADDSYNMFERYNEEGLLYINILKGTDTKYQFHFETNSYMDASDTQIKHPVSITIGLTDSLTKFYISKYGVDAAIDLTTPMESSNIERVKDIPDLLLLDNQAQLARFNVQNGKIDVIYQVKDYYHQISYDNSINKQFIKILREDFCVNLINIKTGTELFDNDDTIEYISVLNYHNTPNVKTHYCIISYKNGKKRIFSFDTMNFIGKSYSMEYDFSYPLNQYHKEGFLYYRSDLAVVNKEVDYNEIKGIISLTTGKILTNFYKFTWNEPFMYTFKNKRNNIPTELSFQAFGNKRKDDYENVIILMYDGTVYPFSQMAQYSDKILDDFFSKHQY